MNKEIISYLFLCVTFKHNRDVSFKITKDAEKKEKELYNEAIKQLILLDTEHKVFDLKQCERFGFIEGTDGEE